MQGGLSQVIKRAIRSITPTNTRAGGGVFIGMLPTGAGLKAAAPVTGLGGTSAFVYSGKPGLATPQIAGTPAVECWIQGLYLSNFLTKAHQYFVEVVQGTATPITANRVLAEVVCWNDNVGSGATSKGEYIPLAQPVYVPAGPKLCLAACDDTGAKTLNAHIILSYNK